MATNDHDHLTDDAVEALFDEARTQNPAPSGDLMARILRDAEAETLAEAQHDEARGARDGPAGRRAGGDAADQHRRDAHREEGGDEGALAADAVAEVAEHDRADGSGDEGDAEDGERGEARDGGVVVREEDGREDEDGGRRVDVEVVELDGRADEARDDDARALVGRRCGLRRRGDG